MSSARYTEAQKTSGDWNYASRIKGSTPLGTTTFIGLRALDVVLQYAIISRGWGTSFVTAIGGTVVSPLAFPVTRRIFSFSNPTTILSSLTPYHATITIMALGSALKQILWVSFVSEQEMLPSFAVVIAGYNTFMNTLNTLLSLWLVTSNSPSVNGSTNFSLSFCTGLALYSVGIFVELWSEIQRKRFKQLPENKGKPYGGGLFGFATNINYGAYTLWRAGYAMVAAGMPWALFIGGGQAYDFITRAIPSMDQYTTEKYGEQWVRIKDRVHYRLLPFIY